MRGTLAFDVISQRFTVEYENGMKDFITSGYMITIYYRDLELITTVEYDREYFLSKYREIPLKKLLGLEVIIHG